MVVLLVVFGRFACLEVVANARYFCVSRCFQIVMDDAFRNIEVSQRSLEIIHCMRGLFLRRARLGTPKARCLFVRAAQNRLILRLSLCFSLVN